MIAGSSGAIANWVASLPVFGVLVGPVVTAVGWLVAVIIRIRRGDDADAIVELVPFACAAPIAQLLLDLHRPWLGDLIVMSLHAVAGVIWLSGHGRRRR